MKIKKIDLGGMWSFRDHVSIEPSDRITIIIGKNNCGKSNILRAVRWIHENRQILQNGSATYDFKHYERHEEASEPASTLHSFLKVSVQLNDEEFTTITAPLQRFASDTTRGLIEETIRNDIEIILDTQLHAKAPDNSNLVVRFSGFDMNSPPPAPNEPRFRDALNSQWGICINQVSQALAQLLNKKIVWIGGWRRLEDAIDNKKMLTHLHQWSAPTGQEKHLRHKFARFQELFCELTQMPDVECKPEHTGQHLFLEWMDRYLPIESYGDGIQHLLMLAFYLAKDTGQVFLLEEPETHLHPELQRHLVEQMRIDKNNQYLLTTHSPVFLDAGLAESVIRISHDSRASSAVPCLKAHEFYEVLDQIGARASDILQANMVIWVEGPTDRMFIRHCLSLLHPSFREGIDYQIVHYGGALRAHMTCSEQPDERLMNILPLSRHCAVICDSDMAGSDQPLCESKIRLKHECEKTGALFWVTAGREIENYFPDSVLTATYRELAGLDSIEVRLDQYEDLDQALASPKSEHPPKSQWTLKYSGYKSRIMPLLLKHLHKQDLVRYDLRDQLEALAAAIHKANSPA